MDAADFGKFLSQQRELRGMSRETVASATKIPLAQIVALEAGELSKLPSRLYVLNYIRAYAGVIGLSPEDALLRYEELLGAASAAEEAAPSPHQASSAGSVPKLGKAARAGRAAKMPKVPQTVLKPENRIERILFLLLIIAVVVGGYLLAVRFGKAPAPFWH